MRSKGLSQIFARLLVFWILIAVSFAIIFFHWKAELSSEKIINENDLLISKKILYAKILLSSELLAYSDDNGVNRGILDVSKVENLDDRDLFEKFSYQPDDASPLGYSHYIRIDVLEDEKGEKKREPVRVFSQPPFTSNPTLAGVGQTPQTIDFPIALRHSQDDIRLALLQVDIIKRA